MVPPHVDVSGGEHAVTLLPQQHHRPQVLHPARQRQGLTNLPFWFGWLTSLRTLLLFTVLVRVSKSTIQFDDYVELIKFI